MDNSRFAKLIRVGIIKLPRIHVEILQIHKLGFDFLDDGHQPGPKEFIKIISPNIQKLPQFRSLHLQNAINQQSREEMIQEIEKVVFPL